METTMLISAFQNERDNSPVRVKTTWAELCENLMTAKSAACSVATCPRSNCQHKKMMAWAPACWPSGATREKHSVEAVCALVIDLDHVPPTELEAHLARLAPFKYVMHSSHSDRPDDRCVRLVLALSHPVLGIDFARFWPTAIKELGVPADPSAKDASRLYYLPSRPADACGDVFDGSGYDFAENDGVPLDVDAILGRSSIVHGATHHIPTATFTGGPSPVVMEAAVTALAMAWPTSGRHQAQLALAGALTRGGWPVELVADFCAAVAERQEAGNGDHGKRLAAARSSAEKLAAGDAVIGWPTVASFVGSEVVNHVTQLLQIGVQPDPEFVELMTRTAQRAHAPTRLEVRAALEHERDRLKKAKDLAKRLDAKLLTKILKGESLTDHVDEDREKALVQAALAIARAAPPGALQETLCEFLLTSAGRLAADVPEVVARAVAFVVEAAPAKSASDLHDPADDDSLRAQLELDKDGRPRPSGANIERVIRFSDELRDNIRFNLMTKQIEICDGRFQDEKPNGLPVGIKNWLGSHWQLTTSTTEVGDQLLRVAQRWHSYDPVTEYLTSLQWDKRPRLGATTECGWLTTYCGVEDTGYARKVGARFLLSAVARALSPGCKVDTVLVLEGDQGARKSTTLGILGGPWFTDTPMVLGDKDSRLLAASKWIVELGELKSLLRDDEASKGFLSQRYDDFRPPYGRAPEQFLRRCVFAGSTNEYEYLQDPTGNRRYWAVRVTRCLTEALVADRDQLWAEAVFRYKSAELHPDQADPACDGERWWFLDAEQIEADEVIAQRRTEDPWVQMILGWTSTQMRQIGAQPPRTTFTMPEIAEHALHIASADMQRYNKKISQALREAGFAPRMTRAADGTRRRVWYRPGGIPRSETVAHVN
jgi:predicted P-loop ATPase